MNSLKAFFFLLPLYIALQSQKPKPAINVINLAGQWDFQIDSLDKGVAENWYAKSLNDKIELPGSMLTNGKGNDVTANTKWTGSIWDSSWYKRPDFAKYRQPGNIKISFWLQPKKHYVGVAWYQKKVTIPAGWHNCDIELMLERCHWETTLWIDNSKVGMQNALGAPHNYDITKYISSGTHTITLRIDNRVKDIDPGADAHSITDNTQTNWNGIIGKMQLVKRPAVYISNITLYPSAANKSVRAKIEINNTGDRQQSFLLKLSPFLKNKPGREFIKSLQQTVQLKKGTNVVELNYNLGAKAPLWDEFNPNVFSLRTVLYNQQTHDTVNTDFGLRDFEIKGTRFTINGRPIFLRGTLECAIFPKTGYPPVDVAAWEKIYKTCKAYGLNHIRFHSWCPPEAAFVAADNMGMYLSIEVSAWATVGDGKPIDQFIFDESDRIVKAFGNHPSFVMMPYGNEAGGKNDVAFLSKFVKYWQAKDSRRKYTSASGFPESSASDYNSTPYPRIQLWGAGLKSQINAKAPSTDYDWTEYIAKDKPSVSHEIGQWCVYPDFKEMPEYNGVLQPKNFEIFQSLLQEHGMAKLADSFLLASGKLQVLCYKADIEAALRTPGFGGFQLLGLYDFPGQGTALVGVLNAFWEPKDYINAKQYSEFCNTVVPLARMQKLIFENNEMFSAKIQVANFSAGVLDAPVVWQIKNETGKILWEGKFTKRPIPIGNEFYPGEIKESLEQITSEQHLTLTVSVAKFTNEWDIFVYPAKKDESAERNKVLVTQQLDNAAQQVLDNGGSVLLTPKKGTLKKDKGGDIPIGFSSIFWNTDWTEGQAPHTLGILCDPANPALSKFPTQYHSNYQWWDAMSHSNAILLDSVSANLKPIVRVIDDWFFAKPLGLIFECKVGKGKLMVSGIDLLSDADKRPEAKQLLYSLTSYMATPQFNPSQSVDKSKILNLFE